jgi:hypothetical protein
VFSKLIVGSYNKRLIIFLYQIYTYYTIHFTMDGGSIPLAKLRKLGVATLVRLINGHGLHIDPDSGLQSDKLAPILQVLIKHRLQRESVVERAVEKKLGVKKRTAKQKAATERLVAANKARAHANRKMTKEERLRRELLEDDSDDDLYLPPPEKPARRGLPKGTPTIDELLEAFE